MRVVYAQTTKSVMHDGAMVPVRKGSHWAADDPIVKENPDLFSNDARFGMLYTREPEGYDEPMDMSPVVEQVTAAPGERRDTRRRRPNDID